jgi:hypothetical protein
VREELAAMNRFLLLVVVVTSIALSVGCAAQQAPALAPDPVIDASWTPPGEMDVSYSDSRVVPKKRPLRARADIKPNAPAKPVRGAIHAALD